MHDTKERLSVLWIFALLNYLYADVVALFAIAGSRHSFEPLSPWALMGSAVLMEIPIAMILACRLLPFRANRLANIIAGGVITLVNGFLTFVPPLAGWGRPPAFLRVLVLRNDRNCGHLGHHLAGVDLVRGEASS
jgi:hypothetical protein